MEYKVIINNQHYSVYLGSNAVKIPVKPIDPKHRAEIEQYINEMNEPNLVVENDIAVLTFDPIPQQMAEWMVSSKAVYFQTVRLSGGGIVHSTSRWIKGTSKNLVREYFPYSFPLDQDGIYRSLTIPNEDADCDNRRLTVEELVNGRIERDISHLRDYRNQCRIRGITEIFPDWCNQYYLGLLYFDSRSHPVLYKMASYNMPVNN